MVPDGWIAIKIGDVLSLEYGKSLSGANRDGGDYPVYGSNGVVGSHSEFLVKGPGIIVGRKGSYGEIVWADKDFFPIDTTYYVLPNESIDIKFSYYLLRSVDLKSLNRSTAIPGLNRNDAYNLDILLPPLPEQKRIAAKLDTLFSHLDQLKTRLKNIPTLLKQFRQAVLTQAVTGKLTEEWRQEYVSDVSELFQQIEVKRKELIDNSGKHRYKVPFAMNRSIDPIFITPEEWSWSTLSSVCDPTRALTYGVIKLGEEVEDGVPCLRTSDVRPLKILLDNVKRISKNIADEYSRTYLKGGEILINVRGTLGGIAVASKDMNGYNVSREIAVAPILPLINSEYLAFYIASPGTQNWLMRVAKGIAYTGINIEDLAKLPIPIASLEEQKEIVRRVESLFAVADRIEASYDTLQEKINHLPQAILSKAFQGELSN